MFNEGNITRVIGWFISSFVPLFFSNECLARAVQHHATLHVVVRHSLTTSDGINALQWTPGKIVTTPTTLQHNLNTEIGLDMKMTVQTPPPPDHGNSMEA